MTRATSLRSLVPLIATLAAEAISAASAEAAFPGRNGDIAYARTYKGGVEIFSSNPRTGKSERLTSKAILDGDSMATADPAFGPDGRRIAFANFQRTKRIGGRRSDIYVMRADGSRYKRLTRRASRCRPSPRTASSSPTRCAARPTWSRRTAGASGSSSRRSWRAAASARPSRPTAARSR